ncbi:MAG TPA: winged helix DNA-binding domain-containing protein [Solirubrobacteraceae bacterium]|nr:winged helix DNA-binding domain-containing protein [Solirubrobacteraceae bacterium]
MIAERLTAQLLSGPKARDPVEVTRHLLAVQGQDPRGARLAIRARSSGLSAADVDRALTVDRSLLITWQNRGTLHLVAREDYAWLHALTTPPLLTGNARRLAQEGVSPAAAERGVTAIARALAADGALPREELRERLAGAGVPTAGQALVHVLMLSSLRGLTVRGPMVEGRHAYVLVRDWLGETETVDRERALSELARRYLAGHGPAEDRDLARWSGLPLRDVRAGLRAIGRELRDRGQGLVELRRAPTAARLPPPRLLGAFDPLLLGWRSREALLGENQSRVTVNGLFRPFALAGGRAVATWKISRAGVALEPFAPLAPVVRDALDGDAKDVLRYLGIDVGLAGAAPRQQAAD